MKPLKYYVAISVDGFIAAPDGSIAPFMNQHGGKLAEGEHVDDFLASYAWFDTVLMGRKTYELGLSMDVTNPYPTMRQFVFSRTMEASPDENVRLVSDHAVETVRDLKEKSSSAVWLCGGAVLASHLWQSQLIDELIVKVNPFVMGDGIPLFSGSMDPADLQLTQHNIYDNGVAVLHYNVSR